MVTSCNISLCEVQYLQQLDLVPGSGSAPRSLNVPVNHNVPPKRSLFYLFLVSILFRVFEIRPDKGSIESSIPYKGLSFIVLWLICWCKNLTKHLAALRAPASRRGGRFVCWVYQSFRSQPTPTDDFKIFFQQNLSRKVNISSWKHGSFVFQMIVCNSK